jgi:hypothetical protein
MRLARRREALHRLFQRASPPLGQVPRQRERQPTRRLAAAALRSMRQDLEGARARTRQRAGTGSRTPTGVRDQRPGRCPRANHERVARGEERIPPRLDRHLGTPDGHALLLAGRPRAPDCPDQLRAAGPGPRRTAAHARTRREPCRGATHGRGRTHPHAAGTGRQGTPGLRARHCRGAAATTSAMCSKSRGRRARSADAADAPDACRREDDGSRQEDR